MNDEQTYELIENYLKNKLDVSKRIEVEKRVETDPEFSKLFDEIKLTHLISIEAGLGEEKFAMSQIDYSRLDKKSRFNNSKPLYILLLVLCCASAIIFWPKSDDKLDNEIIATNDKVNIDLEITTDDVVTTTEPQNTIADQETKSVATSIESTANTLNDSVSGSNSDYKTDQISENDSLLNNYYEDTKSQGTPDNTKKPDPCDSEIFSFKIVSTPSCMDNESGQITINTTEVTSNYTYQLSPGPTSKIPKFKHLASDFYNLKISNKNGCDTTVVDIEVKEVFCPNYHLNIFKSIDTRVNIEYSKVGSGTLIIKNKSGQLIHEITFDVNEDLEWDLKDMNGTDVPNGLYPTLVKYNTGEIKKGSITINE